MGFVSVRTYALISNTSYPLPKGTQTNEAYKTHLKRLVPPSDPLSSSKSSPSTTSAMRKVLHPSNITQTVDAKESGKTAEGDGMGLEVWVVCDERVSDCHVVLNESVEGVEEWDLVK